jgi:hypothetical protein
MSERFRGYISLIQNKFPDGEKYTFPVDQFLYERLYAFYQGHCACCLENEQYWDFGDKDIEKVCGKCGDETFFVKHFNYI